MPAPNAANTISSSGEEAGLGEARKPNGQRRGEGGAGGICGSKHLATDSQKVRSSEPLAELEGIAVYCVDGAGKQTYANLRVGSLPLPSAPPHALPSWLAPCGTHTN